MPNRAVTFTYTNYKGATSVRTVEPVAVSFGANEWHPKPQWLLFAHDRSRDDLRTFAMDKISNWKEA